MDRLSGRRIAIVCREASGLGGTTTTIVEHARRLAALGCSVDVYGWKLDGKRLRAAGAEPVRVPGFSFGSTLKRRLFAKLADAATRRGYDLVHGHGDSFRQDVLSLHNCVHAAHEAVFKLALDESRGVAAIHARQLRERAFKRLIANSKLMKRDVVERFGVPEELVTVIYPGFDPGRFSASDRAVLRAPTRRELGFADGDVVLGLITSGDFKKRGVGEFLDALCLIRDEGRRLGLRALVMGKEAKLGPYLSRVSALGLEDVVRFFPATPDVARFYHALDVYVHPAHFEEFGQSVQEALACGLPVVVGPRVGAAELLPADSLGRLKRLDGLAESLLAFARDASLRRSAAALGPKAVSGNTWDANFAATARVYSSLLETP